ncbi:hypothetical protein PHJA_000860700 [Phtheirospermum japonicum]|uniref:Reverse transcriptase zinc-binding domain-containing protein n=1 Tax=Phtheirospermum japonicum TaxID=374723 RepID=A0A830BHV7_9LAMI|nr:hypothetical protein PHJA_000860700 [Phtheirospermum japonicum]
MWRFLCEKESLWVRVLESKYGDGWGRGSSGIPRGLKGKLLGWWRDIINITTGYGGEWFYGNLERVLGNGRRISFWEEVWVGGESLKSIFPRLFSVSLDKKKNVGEMGVWEGSEWRWEWNWRRQIFDFKLNAFDDLVSLVSRCCLKEELNDAWRWRGSPTEKYVTRDAYGLLKPKEVLNQNTERMGEAFKLLWNKLVPPKVAAHGWRMVRDRLPTKLNLKKRGINLSTEETLCTFCREEEEYAEHFFFACKRSYNIWMMIFDWLNTPVAIHLKAPQNILFQSKILKGKRGKSVSMCIWLGVVWVLWKWRNDMVHNNVEIVEDKLVEEIKARTWSWISVKDHLGSSFSFKDWLANPRLLC